MRVAIIFDHKVRPDTTGVYCRRALGQLVDVEHFLPTELSRIPRKGFDLYLNIDDGLEYFLPADLRPSAWWAIDTHLNYEYCHERARDFDFVFTAQRDAANRFCAEGLPQTCWLPLACDPEIHRKHDVAKTFDTCFVGHLCDGPRADLVRLLQQRFPNSFVGQRFFEEMAQTYSSSRTVFNRSIRNDVNMRVFEALACGSLLLTNDLTENGQDGLAQDGVHLATYRGPEELIDKLQFYLAREHSREAIASAGRALALERHTYRHRMAAVLEHVEKRLSKLTVPVAVPNSNEITVKNAVDSILEEVPPSAGRILLLMGQQDKSFSRELRARNANAVVVEVAVCDAGTAAAVFDRDSPQERFDVIVATRVLELLDEPRKWVERVRTWLKPTGRLLTTFANVRHHSVIRSLLDGNWTYGPSGVAGRAQRCFFTRREIEKLFYRAGWAPVVCAPSPSLDHADWLRAGRPGSLQAGALNIVGLVPADAEEFYAEEYLVRAVPADRRAHGLTSIVILTHNELAYTRLCLESILAFTDEDYELIIVDNASTDGTLDYVRSIPGAHIIVNTENRGFPAGCNQGIQAAKGKQILLLNNDTVVTTGWLNRMVQALEADPQIGLVGPSSNNVSGEQQVPDSYQDLRGLDGFAWELGKASSGQCADTDRLVGFCLLIRREVIEHVGLLDERFGVGCFEDDDYCKRALEAGYRVVHALDAFVHHFGGRTFVGSGVDFAALMRQNQEIFDAKWDASRRDAPPSRVVHNAVPRLYACRIQPDGLRLVHKEIDLSLCMIVRNNARTIRASLESIRPFVDEMVVVDTGSTDETPSLAAELGARVYEFPWCDDFSAARNESLRHARGCWIFWMDSDDTISPACGQRLRELIGAAAPEIFGFTVDVHCPAAPEHADEVTIVTHVKLFRNRPDLRFEHRLHEQILPAIIRAGGPPEVSIRQTDLFVTHSGYDHSPDGQAHKLERDLRILHRELAERPDHPFTLFNLGMTYTDVQRYEDAMGYLTRSLQHSGETDSHVRKAFAYLVACHQGLSQHDEAHRACEEGLRRFPLDAELRFRRAMLLHQQRRLAEAIGAYLDLLSRREPAHFRSVVHGVDGYLARHNLAVVYEEAGELPQAEEQWRIIVNDMPSYHVGWRKLGDLMIRQGKVGEATTLAERLMVDDRLSREGRLLGGQLAIQRGDTTAAQSAWYHVVRDAESDTNTLAEASRLLHEQIGPAVAKAAHEEMVRRTPGDPSAHHNLGVAWLASGDPERAIGCLLKSLGIRPGWPPTLEQLGHAFEASGRRAEAAQIWNQLAQLSRGMKYNGSHPR